MSVEDLSAAFVRKYRDAVARYHMLQVGDRIIVGISGGADSVALLHALREDCRSPNACAKLEAAHLNHNLRGAESARDERFVRELCAGWGIPLTVESRPVAELAAATGRSVELCAREERYAFFRRLGGKTATAHTLDDSAETVLLNLARGAGLRGLCGIPPVRGNIIRPLILCTRAEVEAYCAAHGLEYVTDSTNLSDLYTRNKLRHRVIPVLREINPAFPQGLGAMSHSLRVDEDYLDGLAREALADSALGGRRWDAGAIAGQPEPIRRRMLCRILVLHDIPVERRRIERVEALLCAGGAARLSSRWVCRCGCGVLELAPALRESVRMMTPVVLQAPFQSAEIRVFSDKVLTLTVCERTIFEESINILPNGFQNALDCDKIDRIVTIRQRAPGDAIRLAGRGCTKTLKKLYNEAGLTARQRERTLVLAGMDGLLWVEGFGVCESVRPGSETSRLLLLTLRDL